MKQKLNTTAIYVLSIVSFLCCCLLGLGIVLALPAFLMANKKLKAAELNPEDYEADDIKAMKTAKTVALVAVSVNGAFLLYNIYGLATTDWETFTQKITEAIEKAKNE
jgi:opacity protein-like surface antigen